MARKVSPKARKVFPISRKTKVVSLIIGLITTITGAVIKFYPFKKDHKAPQSQGKKVQQQQPNVSTTGNNSPAVVSSGDSSQVNINYNLDNAHLKDTSKKQHK